MLHTADYTIKANGEDISLLFNTYAYKKYCEAKGIELDTLMKQVGDMLQGGFGLGTRELPNILLAGHQTYCAYNKQPFTAGELEACAWMDAMGGPVNGLQAFADIFKLFVARLLNIDTDQLQTKVESEEKKSEAVANQVSALAGESSTS